MTAQTQVLDRAIQSAFAQLKDAGHHAEVHRKYSGRGMFGINCFGVSMSSEALPLFWIELAVALIEIERPITFDAAELLRDLARDHKRDQLGLDIILYFPGWTLEEEK